MIWMNNELRETEVVVLERVFHVRGYDHFVNFLTVDLAPSAPTRYLPVNSLVPSGVSHTAVTELP